MLNKRVDDYTDADSSGCSSSEFSETEGSLHSSSRYSQQFKKSRRLTNIRSIESTPRTVSSFHNPQETAGSSVTAKSSQANNPPFLLSQASLMQSSQASQSQKRKRKGGF